MITAYVTKWSDLEPIRVDNVQRWSIEGDTLLIYHGVEHPNNRQQRYDAQVFSLAYHSHFHFAVEDD